MRGILAPHVGGSDDAYAVPFSMHMDEADYLTPDYTPGTPDNFDYQAISWWARQDSAAPGNDVYWSKAGGYYVANFQTSGYWYVNSSTGSAREGDEIADAEWHHFFLIWDSAQAIQADRIRCWKDGVEMDFDVASPNPALNADFNWPTSSGWQLGELTTSSGVGFVGKYAEFRWIDGVTVELADFYDTDTNLPVEYTGAYGNEGFYLPFSDIGDLGRDFSGNENHWVTSGSPGQSNDSPTQPYIATSGSAGSEDWNGHSFRHHFTPPSGDWSYIRFKYVGNASYSMDVDNVSVGIKASSGNAYDTADTPVEITFGLSSGINIGNEEIWSDWVAFDISDGDDLMMIADVGAAATRVDNSTGTLGASLVGYYKASTDSYDQATPPGSWTSLGNQARAFPRAIQVARSIPESFEIITTVTLENLASNAATNRADRSLRQVMTVGGPSGRDYTGIRVRHDANTGMSYDLDNVSVGIRSGSTNDTTATPTELLHDGTSGVEIAAGTKEESDWSTFAFSEGDNLLVIHDVASGTQMCRYNGSGGDGTYEYTSAQNSYDQQSVTGFSFYSNDTFACSRIEGKRISDDQD